MSRCFPYPPPPSYSRDGVRGGGPVFESIKIQKERETSITEYGKEKTREKKERRKSKKENKVGKFDQDKKSPFPKKKEEESEKSGLSEEHGQPSSQSICYVSDGTLNSRKRKGDELASNDVKARGNVIRIRLPLCKKKEPDASLGGEQLCTTSGRAETLPRENEVACIPGREDCQSISKTSIVVVEPTSTPCSLESERKKNSAFLDSETSFEQSLLKYKKRKKTESLYKVLIEDWVPPSLQFEEDEFDQEWLFGTKKQERDGCKRSDCCSNVLCLDSSWPPRAQYLSEAGVYALPYTVPF